jgi:hypothetical protein
MQPAQQVGRRELRGTCVVPAELLVVEELTGGP